MPNREAARLTKQAMADALNATVNYFDREVRRHARPAHVRRDGKRLLFYARGVLDAWYTALLRPTQELDDLAARHVARIATVGPGRLMASKTTAGVGRRQTAQRCLGYVRGVPCRQLPRVAHFC